MNRRQLLKLLSMGLVGYELDIDKLLWIPGKKTFFLPSIETTYPPLTSMMDIVMVEWDKVKAQLICMFERDDYFFKRIENKLNDIQG